ncbi:hypothetical protein [uncultured Desulfobacter sp.]|uniref:hypothetical protein n=1 Tax=uncultured Desulfobacter sp. TaxID=240139 RepID=UPI002AABE4C8|nr:hypothetical protein [uncultured Desulfobacter sp.]
MTLDYSWIKQHNDYSNYTRSTSRQGIYTIWVNLNWNIFDGGSTTYTHLGDLRHINALEKEFQDKTANATAAIVQAFTNISDAYTQYQIARAALFYNMGIENSGLNGIVAKENR